MQHRESKLKTNPRKIKGHTLIRRNHKQIPRTQKYFTKAKQRFSNKHGNSITNSPKHGKASTTIFYFLCFSTRRRILSKSRGPKPAPTYRSFNCERPRSTWFCGNAPLCTMEHLEAKPLRRTVGGEADIGDRTWLRSLGLWYIISKGFNSN